MTLEQPQWAGLHPCSPPFQMINESNRFLTIIIFSWPPHSSSPLQHSARQPIMSSTWHLTGHITHSDDTPADHNMQRRRRRDWWLIVCVCVCVNHMGIPWLLVKRLVKRFPELVKKRRAIFKLSSSENVREERGRK